MEHVVFSAAESGAAEEFRRVSSLEEAVRVVEQLRNDLGITESSVFALTPVPLEFKTYYRVEVPSLMQSPAVEPAPAAEIPELRVADLYELPLEAPVAEAEEVPFADTLEAPELIEAVLAEVEPEPAESAAPVVSEVAEPELTDADFLPTFDATAGSVPTLLPPSAAIPPSREDADAEPSLGYFAR